MRMFYDQAQFMEACGQTVGQDNGEQLQLYRNLIAEELQELTEAIEAGDRLEVLDAITDILVVTVGAGLSQFRPYQLGAAWNEVMRSNMSKLDPETGLAIKREDGKVLKGPAYFPPNLAQFIESQ